MLEVTGFISKQDLDFGAQQFLLSRNPIEDRMFFVCLGLNQGVLKSEDSYQVLRTMTYETLNNIYPATSCFRVFTDGFRTVDCVNADVGVFCDIFPFYSSVGAHMSAFDCEIFAIHLALSHLWCLLEYFSKVIILSDSRVALQAMDSPGNARPKNIDDCINLLVCLSYQKKTAVLQWIPATTMSKRMNLLTTWLKKEASILQLNYQELPYQTMKKIIKRKLISLFSQHFADINKCKSWFDLLHDIPECPRKQVSGSLSAILS